MNVITHKLNYVLFNNKTVINTRSSNQHFCITQPPLGMQLSHVGMGLYLFETNTRSAFGEKWQMMQKLTILSYTTFNFSLDRNNFYLPVYTCASVSALQAPCLRLSLHNGNDIHLVICILCSIKIKFIKIPIPSHHYTKLVYFDND